MWYVIQVCTGTEENICLQCSKLIDSETLSRCFIPKRQQQKRIRGQWQLIEEKLFPGYVFIVTEDPVCLMEKLKRVIGLTKLLRSGDEIIPLTDREVELLLHMGGEKQITDMSTGIIENDQVRVLTGPLAGLEGYITRIDRHKRKAWLTVDMFNRTMDMQVGLEIVQKVK